MRVRLMTNAELAASLESNAPHAGAARWQSAVQAGFGAGDLIDIANFEYSNGTQASFKNGTLTLTHGNEHTQLSVAGSYTASNFGLSSDGSGGTLIAFRQPPGQV
jgi:hypothetical protein